MNITHMHMVILLVALENIIIRATNINTDSVSILAVSTIKGQLMSPLTFSSNGATTIYMKVQIQHYSQVQGLDSLKENNEICIAYDYNLCIIQEFDFDSMSISCLFRSYFSKNDQLYIRVQGKQASKCTFGEMYCRVSINQRSGEQLAKIQLVSPSINFPNKELIVKINTFKIDAKENTGVTLYDDYEQIRATSYLKQYYDGVQQNLSEQSFYILKFPENFRSTRYASINLETSEQSSIIGATYSIAPIITSLSRNNINGSFTQININGFRFRFDHGWYDYIKVFIGGKENKAQVLNFDDQMISVQLPNLTNLFQQQAAGQNNLYLSGTGFYYTLYNITEYHEFSYSLDKFRETLINQPDILKTKVEFDGIHPSLDCFVSVPYNYSQYFRGFLKAPISSNFTFFLASNGNASFHISLQNFTISSNSTPFARSQNAISRFYWLNNSKNGTTDQVGQISTIYLEKDNYYYIEIFNIGSANNEGLVTLSVQFDDHNYEFNDFYSTSEQMQFTSLTTSYDAVKEIIGLKVYNNKDNLQATGSYKIQFKQSTDSDLYYISNDLSLQSITQDMVDAIQSSTPYLVSVTAQKINKDAQIVNDDSAEFAGYFYTITFNSYRDKKLQTLPEFMQINLSTEFTYNFQTFNIQQPKGPITGSFQLNATLWGQNHQIKLPNNSIDLPFDVDPDIINDQIISLLQTQSEVLCFGRPQDGRRCYFKSVSQYDLSFASSLQSDSSNVTLTSTKEYYGQNFYEPMAFSMVYTFYDKPQLQVSIYNTIIGCEINQCSLDLNIDNIILSNFALQDSLLSLNLIPPQGSSITQNDFTVKFAGSNCLGIKLTKLTETQYSLQCELEKLNGKPIREAGSNQLPLVSHNLYGYGIFSSDTVGLETQLIIDSITPTTGSPYGGTLVTLKGSGFPKDSTSSFTIYLVNYQQLYKISSVSNQEIKLKIDYLSGQEKTYSINVTFNGKSALTTFICKFQNTYNISSLEFTDLPQYTEIMKIYGNNLGDSVDDVSIILEKKISSWQSNQQIPKVVSVTPTFVEIYTKYLPPGNYSIQYINNQYGYFYQSNTASTIYLNVKPFQQVYLADGVSQPQISLSGGALIKIVGFGYEVNYTFIKINQYICQIDYELSQSKTIFCKLSVGNQDSSDNKKQITLQTYFKNGTSESITMDNILLYNTTLTPLLQNYPANIYNQDQIDQELVTSRDIWSNQIGQSERSLILVNKDVDNNFDFNPFYQFIIGKRKLYNPGDIENLVGVNITGNVWVKFEGPIVLTIKAQINENKITYTIPYLPQGDYSTFIYTQNGNVDKKWITEIPFTIDKISDIYYGGARININGTGFNLNQNLRVTLNNQVCENVEIIDYSQIYCDYQGEMVSKINIVLQQKSFTDDLILLLNYTKPISESNYLLDTIKINSQVQTIDQKGLIETIAGLVQIQVSGSFGDNGILKLSSAFISTITKSNNYIATFEQLPIGKYQIQVQFNNQSAEISSGKLSLNVLSDSTKQFSIDKQYQSSFLGGRNISINGFGFGQEQTKVSICGFGCEIKEINFTSLICEIPEMKNEALYKTHPSLFKASKELAQSDLEIISENPYYLFKLFDSKQTTYYETIQNTDNSVCSIIFNTSVNQYLKLQQLRFSTISNSTLDYSSLKFYFQDTELNWQTIDFRQEIQNGWNTFNPPTDFPQIKAIKLTDSTEQSKSACQISEIEIYGWIFGDSTYNNQTDSITCDVSVFAGDDLITSFKDSVVYSNLVEVTNVQPQHGEIQAQQVITITGSGFIVDKTDVLIDTIKCNILTLNATQITCQTGVKDISKIQISGSFEVRVDGSKAQVSEKFVYIQRWSNPSTWGGWIPQNKTSLIIGQNQTILFDVPNVQMVKLIIDGTLIFSDELDISLQLDHLVINQGKFVIGTEKNPHQHQVQINLLETSEWEIQLPLIGFKSITCYQCQLDFHGKQKSPSWALLNKNAMKDDKTIEMYDFVNWIIGDRIMISSSNIDEIEYRLISSMSQDKKTITLDKPLNFDHLISEGYSVEIAVLGRNIQIIGANSLYGYSSLIGFHFKIIGSASEGTNVRISNTEFFKGGQTKYGLYYPIYFQANQNLQGSYLIGNYFHDNIGPCIAIENAQNVLIQQNVLLNNNGHGIFLISGKEINNIIDRNLVQGIYPTSFYQKSAAKPASFWISNSQNTVIKNRAIGSSGIGFYLQINSKQFCYNQSFISGFEENLARQISSYALLIDIIPSNCQNQPVRTQAIKSFYSWNNTDADLFVLVEMKEQYHKAKYFFNYTENFGVFFEFHKNFYISEFSAVLQVNYTKANLLQLKRSSDIKRVSSLNVAPNFQDCIGGQWYNDQDLKAISVCVSRSSIRIFDELNIFVTEPQIANENVFYGTQGATIIQSGTNSAGAGSSTSTDTGGNTSGGNTGTETGGSSGGGGSGGTDSGNGSGGSSGSGTDNGTGGNTGGTDNGNGGSSGSGTDNGSGGSSGTGTDNGNGGSSGGGPDNGNGGSGNSETEDTTSNWSNSSAWPNRRVPVEYEDVLIDKDKTIYLDVSSPHLGQITIIGTLIVKESQSQIILQAKEINIMDSGKIIIGKVQTPYQSDLIIKSNQINSANGIQIISNTNLTSQTRLTNFAHYSTNTISVSECQGWKIGDSIVISTSNPNPSENEKKIIIGIQDCLITLKDPLQFDHYGASDTTLKKKDIGELDMRAIVLHLSRKIKFQGLDNSCLIKINGTTILQGVEFENCANQDDPGIQLQQQNDNDNPTQLINCSFHEFNGQMLNVSSSDNLIIQNNVFFKGLQQLVEITNYKKIQFNNNVLVYVQKSNAKAWAVLGNFIFTNLQEINRKEQDFSQNIGVASEDAGFYILSQSCAKSNSSSFYNLQCSSAANSCFVIKQFDSNCDYIGQLSASNSQIGIMYSINTEEMRVENIIAAENKINLILKGTTQGQINNQILFSNSYITALARPECSECYQTASQIQYCQNSLGMQMATISAYTYSLIKDNFTSNQYDQITSNERLDIRVYITNVIFDNFKLQYESVPLCQFNSVFRQHPQAYDVTGRHYLINSPCVNCDFDALLYKFRDSNYSQIGVYNGCGSMECTGMKNSLISDETGEFFGEISQAIGNNSNFGEYSKDSCSYQYKWNGYWCKGSNIQVLNIMSIATDQAKRLFSPVKFLENKIVFNILNSFFEWKWNGAIPMNTRESKFAAVVPKNKSISLTVAGANPTSSMFWLSSNSKNKEQDYQIVTWQFQESLAIQVTVNNEVILPGITVKSQHYNLKKWHKSANRTIQFVLTNDKLCIVTISLRNLVSVQTVLKITNQFDADNFLTYLRDQFGGFPYNYYIFAINKYQRRFLAEQESQVEISWGFVDTSEVGTQQAEINIQHLEDVSEKLQSFILPDDLGTLITQSSTISQLPQLNYASSEEQPQTDQPGQSQNNSNGNSSNNNNNNNNNNSTNQTGNEEEFNPVENEAVNFENSPSNNSSMVEQENQIEKESAQKDYTLTIVLAVVLPIVGVAMIIGMIFYMRRKKPDRAILYTCTTSAAEISARPQNKNIHSKKLSIATPIVQEGNALMPQVNNEQNQ